MTIEYLKANHSITNNRTYVHYRIFNNESTEILRLGQKPDALTVNNLLISETDSQTKEGWIWNPLEKGGVLTILHINGNEIAVFVK